MARADEVDRVMPPTARLAEWYMGHGRHELPWRATRDRWAVLVAEVMLQQTQVARVEQMWGPFLAQFPDPGTAAAAGAGALIAAWDRLGYPRRARRLWEIATRRGARLARRPHRVAGRRSLHRGRGCGRGRRSRHGRARHEHPPGRRTRGGAQARPARRRRRGPAARRRSRVATGCSRSWTWVRSSAPNEIRPARSVRCTVPVQRVACSRASGLLDRLRSRDRSASAAGRCSRRFGRHRPRSTSSTPTRSRHSSTTASPRCGASSPRSPPEVRSSGRVAAPATTPRRVPRDRRGSCATGRAHRS